MRLIKNFFYKNNISRAWLFAGQVFKRVERVVPRQIKSFSPNSFIEFYAKIIQHGLYYMYSSYISFNHVGCLNLQVSLSWKYRTASAG